MRDLIECLESRTLGDEATADELLLGGKPTTCE